MVLNLNLARASNRSRRELGEFRKAKSGIQDGTDFFEGLDQGFRGVRLPNERPDETARLAAGPGTCRGEGSWAPTVLGYTCLTGAGLTLSRQRAHVSLDRGWHRVGVLTVAHFEEELGDGCLYAEGGVAHVTPLGITTQSQHQAVQVSVFFRLAKPFACPLPEQGSSQRPFIDTTGQILFIHDRHDRPCSREATSGDKKHLKELQHNHNQNSSLSH